MDESRKKPISVTTEAIVLKIVSEPTVLLTFRGYAPVVEVHLDGEPAGETNYLYIAAKSLSEPLDDLRKKNGGKFTGIHLRLRKESTDKFAPYIVQMAEHSFAKDLLEVVQILRSKKLSKKLTEAFISSFPEGVYLIKAIKYKLKHSNVSLDPRLYDATFRDFILAQVQAKLTAQGLSGEEIQDELSRYTKEVEGTGGGDVVVTDAKGNKSIVENLPELELNIPRAQLSQIFFDSFDDYWKGKIKNWVSLMSRTEGDASVFGLNTPIASPGNDINPQGLTTHAATVTAFSNFLDRASRRIGSWTGLSIDLKTIEAIKALERVSNGFLNNGSD